MASSFISSKNLPMILFLILIGILMYIAYNKYFNTTTEEPFASFGKRFLCGMNPGLCHAVTKPKPPTDAEYRDRLRRENEEYIAKLEKISEKKEKKKARNRKIKNWFRSRF